MADMNEPIFYQRVPATVIYAHVGERLRIHVINADGINRLHGTWFSLRH